MTLIDRQRRALLTSAGVLLAAGFWPGGVLAAGEGGERFVAAQDYRDGSHHVAWSGLGGGTAPVDFRGHGFAFVPGAPHRGVMFGRRPGFAACAFDLRRGEITDVFEPTADRHFYGHGCFSADGTYLYTAENDYAGGRGVIGVRDGRSFEFLGELASHGVGPHEIRRLGDDRLLVANGGIRTHPEAGRRKLALADMDSSLVVMYTDGGLVERARAKDQYKSLRHLAPGPDGGVAVAIQYQRRAAGHDQAVPLLAFWQPGAGIRLADGVEEFARMRDYALSVVVDPQRRRVGLTSPRGHRLGFWSYDGGGLLRAHAIRGVSGITMTADRHHYVCSTTAGELRFFDATSLEEQPGLRRRDRRALWDNHLYNPALAS